MNLPTTAPLVATETQVHRTQVTKASCPQVHGGAVGLETLPMGLPLEFKRTRPPVLEDDCRKIFHRIHRFMGSAVSKELIFWSSVPFCF